MSGKSTVLKGKIKEAAGALTGNDQLRRKGRADQAAGEVEGAVEKAAAGIKKAVGKVEHAVKKAID